ncbi:melanocortin receptor 5-like [Ylistrum balloti]|uniref:melanocortin receptor 5-like n=1 Tax=Ylistrum balloti TaxID=509963 RepID=UPI002905D2B0|nr:melanocortin receptor 5-like [Ylistrum balloti]
MNNRSNTSFLFPTTNAVNLQYFLMMLGTLVVVVNFFSAAALLRCKNMEAKLRQFAVCLTVIDICVGFHLIFMVVNYANNLMQNKVSCYIVLMMPRFTAYVGMFTTTAFAIDRFASIYHWHSSYATKKKTKAFCIAVWLISPVITIMSFLGKSYGCISQDQIDHDRETNALFMIIPMTICFVVISLCYAAVYINIRKHLKKTKDLGVSMKEYTLTMFQSTVVIGVVILSYFVCYGPICILKIYNYVDPDTIVATRTLRNVTQVIYVMNSLIDPVIYSVRFKECRLELKKIFCYFSKSTRKDILYKKKIMQAPFLENGTRKISHSPKPEHRVVESSNDDFIPANVSSEEIHCVKFTVPPLSLDTSIYDIRCFVVSVGLFCVQNVIPRRLNPTTYWHNPDVSCEKSVKKDVLDVSGSNLGHQIDYMCAEVTNIQDSLSASNSNILSNQVSFHPSVPESSRTMSFAQDFDFVLNSTVTSSQA